MLFWIVFCLIYLPIRIFAPFRVVGKKNILKNQNYVIISNHRSNFDAVLLDLTFAKRNRFLAKKELFSSPFQRFFFKNIAGSVCVDREKGLTVSQTKEIYKILKGKENLAIFPEGTRNENFDSSTEFKGGACVFAIKTKKPILPCYIAKKHRFFRTNTIIIGEPFELKEFYDIKLDNNQILKAENVLKEKILELKELYEREQKEKIIVKQLKLAKKQKK